MLGGGRERLVQGIDPSVGTLAFVPPGFPGAGDLKIASYDAGTWYTVVLSPDGNGTYDIISVSDPILLAGGANGPEGIIYVDAAGPDASRMDPSKQGWSAASGRGRVAASGRHAKRRYRPETVCLSAACRGSLPARTKLHADGATGFLSRGRAPRPASGR